ncbi:hypothetical protein BAUCODRAFT_70384 [Baudoinia panamericana UAMH 10762]|uniref:Conserved oligomeric Golgi complex subunit 1 n=1 Tax=Baudoinia panamericana (strain UAMH 10762) TaxID=717646 RepID=M2LP79_BAUPA|nr:uncharacterized protein BAUCODRAFT_70384 [Baudoinia panamericana UAMH 10762]EMC96187.1 hypothetical protein BAUCODRAFT_70384 [Baudoinia panamericana UAMH 10762]
MAVQPPDPRTFNSWEDAFQYPLPVVRKLEQQLRKNLDENRSKLRSLVGASYRDLLGTAERIVEMDERMRGVEGALSGIARGCNVRVLERKGEGLALLRRKGLEGEVGEGRRRVMAQTKILQSTLTTAGRIMKEKGDALVVAKLLVLARLLLKSVSESTESLPDILEELRRRLAVLRKKLGSYIDRSLVRPRTEKASLVNTLAAFTMISSAGPKEVLHHLLQVRCEQMEHVRESPTGDDALTKMLELYKHTLTDIRALFPRLYADSLAQLGKVPLMQDEQIRSLYHLNLDVYGIWVDEAVRAFTPWVRHEQLLVSDVQDALVAWSRQAHECVVMAVKESVRAETDVKAVLGLRKKVLARYLALGSSFPQFITGRAVTEVSGAFMEQLCVLAKQCASSGDESLEAPIGTGPPEAATGTDIWGLAVEDFDLSNGASSFREAIIQRRNGRDTRLRAIRNSLSKWEQNLLAFQAEIQQMRSVKWEDEADIDLDDIPDGESMRVAMCKDDPDLLHSTLRSAVEAALTRVTEHIRARSESYGEAALLLRLLRDLHERRQSLATHIGLSSDDKTADGDHDDLIATLHNNIVKTAMVLPLVRLSQDLKRKHRPPTVLWDAGTPPLPVQPSPATFRFLTKLCKAMADEVGVDVWSPDAVLSLRRTVERAGSEQEKKGEEEEVEVEGKAVINGHHDDSHASHEGDHAPSDESAGAKDASERERNVQHLFDAIYLQIIFLSQGKGKDPLSVPIDGLRQELEVEDASFERLKKSAGEYWKRTYLLFGLLARTAV